MKFAEIRAKYPQYDDVPDEELAVALHKKYYPDASWGDFSRIVGLADHMAARDTGAGEAALVGAGKAFTDLGRGVQDLYHRATGNEQGVSDVAARQRADAGSYGALSAKHPVATAVGESAPYVGGGGLAGMTARGGGLITNLLAQGAQGAAIGGTMHQENLADRGVNAAIESGLSMAGEGIGRAIGRVAMPRIQKTTNAVVDKARSMGYLPMPSTEMNQSGTVRQGIEGGLEASPGGGIALEPIYRSNQNRLNDAALEAIGNDIPDAAGLTGEVLDRAHVRLGDEFKTILDPSHNFPVAGVNGALDAIESSRIVPAGPVHPQDIIGNAINQTRDLLFNYNGELPGDVLHMWQSKLGQEGTRLLRGQYPDPESAFALFDMQAALLDAAADSMPPGEREALTLAKKQYRDLMNLETGRSINSGTGDVNAQSFASVLERRDKKGFTREHRQDPLYTGTKFLGRVQTKLPSSATAERSWMREILKAGGVGAVGGAGVSGASGHDPVVGGLGGMGTAIAGGVLAPNIMARTYLAPATRKWLTMQMPDALAPVAEQTGRAAAQSGIRGVLERP